MTALLTVARIADGSELSSLQRTVETVFERTHSRGTLWHMKLIFLPDNESESQILVACAADGKCTVERSYLKEGVYLLFRPREDGFSRQPTAAEVSAKKKEVMTIGRKVGAQRATKWVRRILAAVEKTPSELLAQSLIVQTTPMRSLILHPTTYVVILEDFELQLRIAAFGPVLAKAKVSPTPLVSETAAVEHEVRMFLAESAP